MSRKTWCRILIVAFLVGTFNASVAVTILSLLHG